MKEVLEILKYTLPSLIVFATAYMMLKKILQAEKSKRQQELWLNNRKTITPIRLQAYERVILFLERISAESLLMREMQMEMTAKQLQRSLLESIRIEYEHNLVQQIYISTQAWKTLKSAKENTLKIINTIAANMKEDATALELSKTILEYTAKAEISPTETAIEIIKNEIKQLF